MYVNMHVFVFCIFYRTLLPANEVSNMRPSGNCWGAVRVSIIRPTMRANHLAAWHSGERRSLAGELSHLARDLHLTSDQLYG